MSRVRSACSRGLTAYLAEQHTIFRTRKLATGMVAGAVASGALILFNKYGNLGLEWWMTLIPFGLTTIASAGAGAITANNRDLEIKEAFDVVCKTFDDESQEDGE